MPPRTIKFKDKKTGKIYDMPWDSDDKPTAYDYAKFADDADNPDIVTRAKSLVKSGYNKASELGDKALSAAFTAPAFIADPIARKTKQFSEWIDPEQGSKLTPRSMASAWAENFSKGLTDTFLSPGGAALTALSGGTNLLAGQAAKGGVTGVNAARAANLGRTAERVAAGTFAAHGVKGAAEGIYEGDKAKTLTSLIEAGAGALGAKTRGKVVPGEAPLRTGPLPAVEDITNQGRGFEVPYAGAGGRGIGTGSVVEGPQTVLPPERGLPAFGETEPPPPRRLPPTGNQSPLPNVSDRGLPPSRPGFDIDPETGIATEGPSGRTFYAGETGAASTNINEPATRTFRGGPGLASPGRMPVRNWSDAMARTGELKSNQPLTEVPGPTRDILPQTSPYRRGLQATPDLPIVEGEVLPPAPEAPPPIAPVSPEITPPIKGGIDPVEAKIAANEARIKALQDRIKGGDKPRVPAPEPTPEPISTDITEPPTPEVLEPTVDRSPVPKEGESHQDFQRRTRLGKAEAARIYNKAKAVPEAAKPEPEPYVGDRPHIGLSDKQLRPLVKARDPQAILEATRRPSMQKEMKNFLKKAAKVDEPHEPFDTEAAGRKRTETENDWRQEMLADGHPADVIDAAIDVARKHKVDLADVWSFSDLNQKIRALSETPELVKGKKGGRLGKVYSSLETQVEKLKAEMTRLKGEQGSIGPDVKAGMEARRARLGLDKPKLEDLPDLQETKPQTEFERTREESKAKAARMVDQLTREFGDITTAGLQDTGAAKDKQVSKYLNADPERRMVEDRFTKQQPAGEAVGLEGLRNQPGLSEFSPDIEDLRPKYEPKPKPDISGRRPAMKMGRRSFLKLAKDAPKELSTFNDARKMMIDEFEIDPEDAAKIIRKSPRFLKSFVGKFFTDETGAIGPDIKKGMRGKKRPFQDMFDRGSPELDTEQHTNPFTHENFLSDLRESLGNAGKRLRKDLKGEKGFWKPFDTEAKVNPKKEAKAAATDWIRYRQAAIEHGRNAAEAVRDNPAKAKELVDKAKDTLKTMGIKAPKLEGMTPEQVGDFILKSKIKIANIRFNDWLKDSGYMGKGGKIDTSTPIGKNLAKWKANHLMPAKEWAKHIGDFHAWTKNIYLAGGIPGTPINIHGANIAMSDIAARGFGKGIKSALEGVFRPSVDKAVLKQYKHLIPEAIENGFTWHNIEDKAASGASGSIKGLKQQAVTSGHSPEFVKNLAEKVPGGSTALKGLEYAQGKLENPLFQRYLPARKLKFLAEKVEELQKRGMGRKEAMQKAATMSNDFYGGVEKVLRDRTGQNLVKAVALAPDWFESRMTLAAKQLKSVVGAEDRTYSKALARSVGMRLTREAAIILGGGKVAEQWLKDKPSELTDIPAGTTSKGRKRSIPTLGTSNELLRLGEEGLAKTYREQNPGVLFDVAKNRLSQPLQSAIQLAYGQDEFGNPIRGRSKFGKKIKLGKSAYEHLKIGTRPFQPQIGQSLVDYAEGNIDLEEALVKGAELPVQYRSKKVFGRAGR